MTDSLGTHKYSYDATYQLVGVDCPNGPDQQYGYDSLGNRISVTEGSSVTTYSVDRANRYTKVGDATYTYNGNGCLIEKKDSSGTTTYEYDNENHLIAVSSQLSAVSYTYDALGRRIERTSTGAQEHTSTRYVYDGDRVIAETDEAGNVIAEYVYGAGLDEILYMIRGSLYYYYHYDGLGNVRAITNSKGVTVESYTYDVYGKPTIYNTIGKEIPESQVGNDFLFTGKMFDYDTGLYYYRNRYYDPELGRFITPDPLGQEMPQSQIDNPRSSTVGRFDFSPALYYYRDRYYDRSSRGFMSVGTVGPVGGSNLYTYCNNNPVSYTDPLGLCYGKAQYNGGDVRDFIDDLRIQLGEWLFCTTPQDLYDMFYYIVETVRYYSYYVTPFL